MINGVPRFGTSTLMTRLGADGERVSIGGRQRMLFMKQESADEVVSGISLGQAKTDARRCLEAAAGAGRRPREQPERSGAGHVRSPGAFRTAGLVPGPRRAGVDGLRASPPPSGRAGPRQRPGVGAARAVPLSQLVGPMTLDPLTVADDANFLDRVAAQTVLPEYVRRGLKGMY